VAAAAGTAAHHGFELAKGIGLVWQPELGLVGAGVLWGTQLPAWAALAWGGGVRGNKVLAVASGASLGGALVHYLLWPWRFDRFGIPYLTEAEGMPASALPAYNAVLRAWVVASLSSIAREVSPRDRAWVAVGLATTPLLIVSAKHHFVWLHEQSDANPAWWNRGARAG
jgi:hypothetical protein